MPRPQKSVSAGCPGLSYRPCAVPPSVQERRTGTLLGTLGAGEQERWQIVRASSCTPYPLTHTVPGRSGCWSQFSRSLSLGLRVEQRPCGYIAFQAQRFQGSRARVRNGGTPSVTPSGTSPATEAPESRMPASEAALAFAIEIPLLPRRFTPDTAPASALVSVPFLKISWGHSLAASHRNPKTQLQALRTGCTC